MADPRPPTRRAARLAGILLAGIVAGCAPEVGTGDEPVDCPDHESIEDARAVLAQAGADGNLAAEAHDRDASVYIFQPRERGLGDVSRTVLLIADCRGAVYSEGRLGRDAPATVERLGASSGGADEDVMREPGYLVGIVRDRRIRGIEMYWPVDPGDATEPGSLVTPVASGPFINPVPDHVPLGVHAGFRALDADGNVIAELTP